MGEVGTQEPSGGDGNQGAKGVNFAWNFGRKMQERKGRVSEKGEKEKLVRRPTRRSTQRTRKERFLRDRGDNPICIESKKKAKKGEKT